MIKKKLDLNEDLVLICGSCGACGCSSHGKKKFNLLLLL